MAATPPTLAPEPVGRAAGYGGPITFSCVSNILVSICNLGLCPDCRFRRASPADPRKNNNAITVKMAGKGDPRRKEVPQPSPVARLERPNVRPPRQRAGFHAQIW